MIDHSINLYFEINLFHNVSAPMSFHSLCFVLLFFPACSIHAFIYSAVCFIRASKNKTWQPKESRKNYKKVLFSFKDTL